MTETMGQAKDQAVDQAQHVAGRAKERARGMIDERSSQAGDKIVEQASDVRTIAEQLREQGKGGPARIADQAADRAERMGKYLRETDGSGILDDVERVARDNPWVVVAGGVVLGFVASRFLKASSRQRYQASTGQGRRPQLAHSTGAGEPPQVAEGAAGRPGVEGGAPGATTSPPMTPPGAPAPAPAGSSAAGS